MNQEEVTHEALIATVAKAVPPMTVAGMTLFGVPLPDLVLIVTLIWLSLQIMGFCYDRVSSFVRSKKQ